MGNPKKKRQGIIKWLLVALAAVLLVVAFVVAWNWMYVRAALQAAGVLPMPDAASSDVLDTILEAPSSSAAFDPESPAGSGLDSVSSAASSDAASEEASASSEEEEPVPEETDQPEQTAAPSPTPAASSSASSAAATPSPSPTSAPAASAAPAAASPSNVPKDTKTEWEKQVDKQITALRNVEKDFEARLYGIMWEAFDEYMSLPAESRNLMKKVSIILSKKGQLSAMEAECDKEVAGIVAELRRILTENGQSTALADEAEKAYKDKKSALMAELMKQAYSGGDGSGQSGAWLSEHAPR